MDELLQVASAAIVAITARTLEQTASQPLEHQEARVQIGTASVASTAVAKGI